MRTSAKRHSKAPCKPEQDVLLAAGNSPLHYAVTTGKTAVAEFLLGKGVWLEGSNGVDDSVLHIAAR